MTSVITPPRDSGDSLRELTLAMERSTNITISIGVIGFDRKSHPIGSPRYRACPVRSDL